MDQENDNGDSCGPAEVSAKSLATKENNDDAEDRMETSAKSTEMNSREAENPVEVNTTEAGLSGERPKKAQSSKKRIVKSLKAKAVVKKKPSSRFPLGAKKAEGNPPQVQKPKKKKIRRLLQHTKGGDKNNLDNDENVNSREDNLEKDVSEMVPDGKIQESKEEVKNAGPSSSQHARGSENDRDSRGKRSRRRHKKGKLDEKETVRGDERKKEKLGGLIFLCSAKTKPDCFRYQVMGVTGGKKDLVLGVRPGLKLFLYDFDLKLMYGVYKATSSGGMKLEPKAFGGSFPVQVRFGVHKDCVPLPESVFKRAIKENYDGKNKFDIELTGQQVKNLCALFRPVGFQSLQPAAVTVHSSSRSKNRDREAERSRDSRPHLDRETYARANGDGRSYPVLSHERDKRPMQQEVVLTRREQAPQGLYMSEQEYRTYGLQRERRNLTPPLAAPTLDPYRRDVERERLLRHPSPYNERVPLRREVVLADPLYSTQREPQSYNYSGRSILQSAAPSASAFTAMDPYARDPYYSYPPLSTASGNAYVLPIRRQEGFPGSYHVEGRRNVYAAAADPPPRREIEDMNKLYLKYSVDLPADYNQAYQAPKTEAVLPPVSSRYSFAGPSVSYR
ncbi:DCD (Development and Cell Death) domain protein [Euphorbia peplus]|nr:DCD (Development and Cell Death) domain protein [Euphorbia peplus]